MTPAEEAPSQKAPSPPSVARVVWLVTRLALRRFANRNLGRFRRRAAALPRRGTARKDQSGRALVVFFSLVLAFNSVHFTTSIVRNTAMRAVLRDLEVRGPDLSPGIVRFHFWPNPELWYDGLSQLDMLLPLGFVGALSALAVTLTSAFGPQSDLSRVESTLEWWFTFPVSPRGLLLARVLETAFVNGLLWFTVLPYFAVVYACAGFGYLALPLGAAVTIYVGLLAGSLRVLAETTLRRWLSLRAVSRVQALLSVVASVLIVCAATAVSPAGLELQSAVAMRLPAAALLNPFSLPIAALHHGALGVAALVLLPLTAAGSVACAVLLGAAFLRDGLVTAFSENQGGRSAFVAEPARSTFAAIARKELLSVVRNRTRLSQTVIGPLLILGVQLVMNPNLFAELRHAPRVAAAVSYGVAAIALSGGATGSLIAEVSAVWLLFTFPRSLDYVLIAKATVWAAAVTVVAGVVFAGLVFLNDDFQVLDASYFLLVPIGVTIQAFVAVSLGALGTDPFATDARRQLRPAMAYLFLLVAGMFGYALYTPSAWGKFVEIVLSTLLAFALWQKVRDHAPYLLDPTEAPPPQIAVADGILAALAFFVLQGTLVAIFAHNDVSPGKSLLYAFVGAGIVVAFFALLVLRQTGLPDLATELGLRAPGAKPLFAVALGLAAGVLAFGVGAVYTRLIEHVAWLSRLRDQTFELAPRDRSADMAHWFGILAVCAAPPVEEFIFRGLLFRGLRRSMSLPRAVVASALVFALVHPPIAFFPVFVLAALAATVYERSRLLIAPIIAHAVYNGLLAAFALQ
jgi:hypothetical protein